MEPTRALSTGQAARLLAVTPDTVLKWIKKGRLHAVRTAGGHYRVRWSDVQQLRQAGATSAEAPTGDAVYCWQFHAQDSEAAGRCEGCIVRRAHALHCFHLSGRFPAESYAGTHCETSCLDCAYYLTHHGERIRVLVVASDPEVQRTFAGLRPGGPLDVAVAGDVYTAAVAVQALHPEYVVLHGSLTEQQCCELERNLRADDSPRRPHVLSACDGDERGALRPDFTVPELLEALWPLHRDRLPGASGG